MQSLTESRIKLLTIFVLTYNRSEYLNLMLDSILRQEFGDYDIIVMDNASTDDTENIVRSKKSAKITYLRNKCNIGAISNGNKALRMADSKYTMLVHDDDMMNEKYIAEAMNILEKKEEIVLVSCNAAFIDENSCALHRNTFKGKKDKIFKQYEYIRNYCLTSKNIIVAPSVIMRTEFIKKIGLKIDETAGPASDILMWSEINANTGGNIYIISKPLFYYRIHKNQDSSQNALNFKKAMYGRYSVFLNSIGKQKLLKIYSERFTINSVLTFVKYYFENRLEFLSYIEKLNECRLNSIIKYLFSSERILKMLKNIYSNYYWVKR